MFVSLLIHRFLFYHVIFAVVFPFFRSLPAIGHVDFLSYTFTKPPEDKIVLEETMKRRQTTCKIHMKWSFPGLFLQVSELRSQARM